MGAHLVGFVLTRWTHVSDRAFRVLVRMAHTALDKPKEGQPAGVYRGGRELLAMALRSEKGTPETRYRAVKRAVAELSQAGAIQHVQGGWAGQNSVYRLTLEGARSVDAPQEKGGLKSPPKGGRTSPPMGGPSGTEWGAPETPPRNQEEVQSELDEEEVVDLPSTSHPPREAARDEPAPVIELYPGARQEAPYRPARRWTTRGMDTVAESMARTAARRAAYQAQRETS